MIYSFLCTNEKCKQETEEMMKVAEYEKTKNSFTCPKCKTSMAPKVTAPHFSLIGGGWARDQYTNHIKNTQKKELDTYDKHLTAHEKLMRKEERLGEFVN